jgi:hypothetical protein
MKSDFVIVKTKYVEKLCVALNCTPNDSYEWTPDAKTVLPEAHSLNAPNKGEGVKNLRELVKDIPSDTLRLIESLLNELKGEV